MSEDPTVKIPKDVIQPIIEARVSAAVLDAIGDKAEIIRTAVAQVLNARVGRDGKPDRYGEGKYTWLSWNLRNSIEEATMKALTEAVGQHEKAIKDVIVKELQKKNSPMMRDLVRSMAGGIAEHAKDTYKINVTVGERDYRD